MGDRSSDRWKHIILYYNSDTVMDFYEVLNEVVVLLQQHGRVSHRALKRQFGLDDDFIEDLKDELLHSRHPIADEDGQSLIWTGDLVTTTSSSAATPSAQPDDAQEAQTAAVQPSSQSFTPDAERRQLTVMFCDLADSTKLSGQLDPEDLRDVIRAYQSTSAEIIERFDGYVAQHLGDGLMVYFGWPQAHEDDPQRAVHTGLDILEAMQGLNVRLEQEKGIRLAVRIGVHTGLVVVGEIGKGSSQEHLALGETPNIASRIEGIAARDTVAISDATHQLVQGYFTCEDLGQYMLRGMDDAQHVHRVIRESDVQSRFDVAAIRGLTPLVGRESETRLLLERWQQVKEGQGQVVLLSGEAGIGKSRLLQVLRERISDESHIRLECRSSPYYQNTALYPLIDLMERGAKYQRDDTPEAKLAKLEQMMRQYTFPLEETVPLFAPLLSLAIPEDRYPPFVLSPQRQRQKTLQMIVAMVSELAKQQPLLFIVEDTHWLDPTSLELLDLLIDQVPTTSLLTLFTSRPTFQPTWSSRSYLTHVTLNRLSRGQIERMVAQLTDGKTLPAEIMAQLVEKTDGVPLFVEEMTKAVLESNVLNGVDGQYALTKSISTLAIPATLQDSLMARLDRLVTAKAVAQYASVIGRQFSYELIQAVSQLDARTLQRELGRLVEVELIYQKGMPPQATYTFKHALIQDAAYASLLRRTRQQYHQQIAQVLEEQFPETAESQPELLAHHFTEAGLIEQAILYWQQGGENAIQRSANQEAIAHLTQGLAVLATLPETPQRIQQEITLHLILSAPIIAAKGYTAPELEQTLTRARILCEQLGDTPRLAQALLGLHVFYHVSAIYQTARELGEQSLSLAQQVQAPGLLLAAHGALGWSLCNLGELVASRTYLEQGMTLYNPQQHRELAYRLHGADLEAAGLSWLARVLWLLGYADQARQKTRASLVLSEELAHPHSLALALGMAAILHQLRGELDLGKEHAETLIALSAEHGFPVWGAIGTMLDGWMLAIQGHHETGITQMQQGLAVYDQTGGIAWQPYFLALLAEAHANSGNLDAGLEVLAEALELVERTKEGWWEAGLYRLKGELLLQQTLPDKQQAESCFQLALDLTRHQQAKSLELRAATSLARLWQSQGKRQDAYDLLMPVYEWFTEGFDTADLKEARAILNELA